MKILKNVVSKSNIQIVLNVAKSFVRNGSCTSSFAYESAGMIEALKILEILDNDEAELLLKKYRDLGHSWQSKEEDKIRSSMAKVMQQKKNERGAGRKPVLTDEQKTEIKEMRKEGYSYRSIAETFGVSHMTIKKALEE